MRHKTSVDGSGQQRPKRIRDAMRLLCEARWYAKDTSGDDWEFAIELEQLTAIGLTRSDFRWLVRKGWVEHQREITLDGEDGRSFRKTGDLAFPEGTCFVLTDVGTAIAMEDCRVHVIAPELHQPVDGDPVAPVADPSWDSETRELRFCGELVKGFKWPAVNQELILAAFEEEGWPRRVDDPLPPDSEQDSKRRLSDTIKCLNRKQVRPLIRFHGDGTGEGVTWERIAGGGLKHTRA